MMMMMMGIMGLGNFSFVLLLPEGIILFFHIFDSMHTIVCTSFERTRGDVFGSTTGGGTESTFVTSPEFSGGPKLIILNNK